MTADVVLSAQTANSTTTYSSIKLDPLRDQNAVVYAWGVWNGATITVNVTPDGVNYMPFTSNTLTIDGLVVIPVSTVGIQIVITGVGLSTSLSVSVL